MTSDEIAFWSMIGSWVSGIATFLATAVAAAALNSWRKQDRAKSRREVKASFISYAYALSDHPVRKNSEINLDNVVILTKAFGNCVEKMILCEDKKFLKRYVNKTFAELQNAQHEYLETGDDLNKVHEIVNKLATTNYDI